MSGLLPYFVNLRAKVKSGLKDVVFWISAKSDARALREMENALEDADIKRSAFFKDAVITGLPVYNDLPQEGELDFTWCERYVFSDDTGTWLPVVPAQPESADSDNVSIGGEHTDENATDNTDSGDTAGTSDKVVGSEMATGTVPSWDVNVNGEPMADVEKLMLHPVATLSERHRILSQFILEDKFSRQITPEQLAEVNRLEMDISNNYIQDMLQACHNVPAIQKLDTPDLWKFTDAVKRIFPQDKQSALYLMTDFAQAFANTEYIDRGLLVNEWCAGRYVSRIEKPAAASASEVPATQKKPVAKVVEVEYPRRSEKATHRTINIEIASALIPEADPCHLRPVLNQSKDIIHSDREDWKRWSATLSIIPEIKTYSRQTIFDVIRKAPKAVHTGNPDLRRTWCESFLAVHGIRDPDWYEHVPDNVPTTHEENIARVRKAGKCLRDIEAGRFLCDEEEPQSAGALADEPAVPETVEPDTTEHNQDAQPLDAQSQVDPVEVAYQKKQAELEEARKNIPPKNPVDFDKQLAAARGEYVEGISDPNDPKWVRDDYSASNQGEKTENEDADDVNQNDDTVIQNTDSVNHSEPSADQIEPEVLETEPKNPQPEPVTKVADGVFDASAFFADTSNQGEKTENPPSINDDHSTEIKEEKNTAAFDQNGPVLEKIARLLEVNNQLLETSISHQFAAFRRREKFLKSLVLALTTCCENHNTEDETDEQ
ncbi:RecE family exodeoxyribonuclease [Salmonella enterica]|uniref:RecE family exodeoxyribonuclease n=1 Tax=Salmonella enterica TaxID=28901 RepID=UPI0014311B6B|nr:RecE family exodeoxyribonuclease [Salmonella enterica]